MQTLETDLKNIGVKGDEECINFRPSPNFKHMRKYCKSKKENANENNSGVEQGPMLNSEETDQVVPKTVMVQPPLPPNPPPPDTQHRPLVLKKEIEDTEYSSQNDEPKSPTESVMEELNRNPEENQDKSKKTMCRQWARGKCTRGAAACNFVHEIIHSQLPEVYTFCKNFQNTRCFYPKCKFVHATVFEKEHFFRTGYLPPHTLAHLTDNAVKPTAPPTGQEGSADLPGAFANPPPTVMPSGVRPTVATVPPTISHPVGPLGVTVTDVPTTALAVTSPHKREWTIEEFNGATALDSGEPVIKKCKYCVMNEFRLQCNKNKVIKMMKASEEMHKQASLLTKKNDKLHKILVSLLQTASPEKENGGNVLNTPMFNIRNEKEKTMMEQIDMIFSGENRISLSTEEKTSNISNISSSSNFSSVLVKLLLNNSEQTLSSDLTSS